MKKLIAILAIMVVLAGAVFASEGHTIRVKADVTEVIPAFQLMIDLTEVDDFYTNTTPTQYGNNAYSPLTNDTAKDVEFNLDQNGNVTVKCYLANFAKTTHKYTLVFSDGAFKNIKKNKQDADDHAPTSITTSTGANVADTYTITLGTAHVDGDDTKPLLTNQAIEVQFHGKTVETKDVVLAQAVYAYTKDPAIDPGVYYADITLTITTD